MATTTRAVAAQTARRKPASNDPQPRQNAVLFERYAHAALSAGLTRAQFEIFARAGIVLQEKQLSFAAACFACDDPDGPNAVGFGGARGGGKSHAGLAVLAADCLRYAGLTCLLLRKVGKANRENFNELRLKVLRGVSTTYKVQEGVLVFENGSKIVLGHFKDESDIDAYLGLEYDAILVEEATTLTASKNEAIGTCNRTSKPGWRPRRYYTTNPGGIGHAWFKALFIAPFQAGREKQTRFVPSTVDDNRCVNREYKGVLDNLSGWQKRAWRFGDWDIAAGQFFTNFSRERHVVPNRLASDLPKSYRFGCALDYGFTHWTVVTLLAQSGDGDLLVLDQWRARRTLPGPNSDGIKAMLTRHGLTLADLRFFVAGHDVFAARGNDTGATIADNYETEGIKLTRANLDRINGAGEMIKRLGDADAVGVEGEPKPILSTLFVMERCAGLIECLPLLQHDPHRPEDVLKVDCDEEGRGGDDDYDSARYGVMEFMEKPAPSQSKVTAIDPRHLF